MAMVSASSSVAGHMMNKDKTAKSENVDNENDEISPTERKWFFSTKVNH